MHPYAFPARAEQGFTLIEAVVVMVLTGIVAAVVAVFITRPVQGYLESNLRAGMSDTADSALRRIGRDLRLALPNSVRVSDSNRVLEFLSTSDGGRYRINLASDGTGDVLDIGNADTSFDIIGPPLTMSATTTLNQNQVVIYNLGIAGADAYAGSNRATFSGGAGAVSTMSFASKAFPLDSPARRFHIVSTPVAYVCDPTTKRLTRYWGYTINSAAWTAASPPAGQSAVLANDVASCKFRYEAGINERNGLVTMRISLAKNDPAVTNNPTVTLYHEVHVSNVP
jgi:MSHA biogenesis protein MshO